MARTWTNSTYTAVRLALPARGKPNGQRRAGNTHGHAFGHLNDFIADNLGRGVLRVALVRPGFVRGVGVVLPEYEPARAQRPHPRNGGDNAPQKQQGRDVRADGELAQHLCRGWCLEN